MQLQKAEREQINARSGRFSERIDSTLYRVSVYFPAEETETLEAKIVRMVKNDLTFPAKHAKLKSLQTVRLPERDSL
jgi:hypothetical protein